MGTISLGTAQADNSGTTFGVASTGITALSVRVNRRTLHLSNADSAAKVTAAVKKQKVTLKDLAINIL
jgi:hypothetical protein